MTRMLVLCLHDIVEAAPPNEWAVTARELESLLERYRNEGRPFVTLDELPHSDERSVALTIDDGRASAVTWLRRNAVRLGIRATLFAIPGWIDAPESVPAGESYSRLATWDALAELAGDGQVIGSHTVTHVRLPSLADEDLRRELHDSRRRIEEALGVSVAHFAAPYGALDDRVVRAAADAGYRTVSSTRPGMNGETERRSGVLKRFVLRRDRPRLGLPEEHAL
jgi:peptidoglycan/xylan/chitin deacetylase (PgdA/CDA1 family)